MITPTSALRRPRRVSVAAGEGHYSSSAGRSGAIVGYRQAYRGLVSVFGARRKSGPQISDRSLNRCLLGTNATDSAPAQQIDHVFPPGVALTFHSDDCCQHKMRAVSAVVYPIHALRRANAAAPA